MLGSNIFTQPHASMDIQFEEEIKRNPYNVKVWWAYAHSKMDQLPVLRFAVYERALSFVPRSYKLWHAYLQDRVNHLSGTIITSRKFDLLIQTFERALVHMNKMPRIWLDYCKVMVALKRGSETRKVFDRALQALPVTQHREIWKSYISWVKEYAVAETAIRVFRRYLMYDPNRREEYIEYLEEIEQFEEAARQISICLNDEQFHSPSGKTQHQIWMHLCTLCCNHPESVMNTVNVEAIIRSGINKFSDEVGKLWNSLADYYIGLGHFGKARDIFEEALRSVSTVRDFTIVFDSYVKVEESILTAKMRILEENVEIKDEADRLNIEEETNDINLRLARIEHLMEKRPLLLNSVVLRQNPNNVHEWHKRAKLMKTSDNAKMLSVYEEATKTIDPTHAIGKFSTVFIVWASLLENSGNLHEAERVFKQAVKINFKSVDEFASVWCGWAEMLLRLELFGHALEVMRQAVEEPQSSIRRKRERLTQGNSYINGDFDGPLASDKLYRNVKVWSLLLDLEESFGSIESCRAGYERVMDLKVITAQMVLNYASFLEEQHYYEDSFQVYEKAISLFEYPQLKSIWLAYLDKFADRYNGLKLERLRDLYEQAVAKVPPADAAEFFIKYAHIEEQYGLARHVVAIYDRATKAVLENHKLDMFRLYIKKVEILFGIVKTRPVYERALKELSDDSCKRLCIEYAEMERKLGEIDRARSIFVYGSQFADPKRDINYWKSWQDFEETFGNEETFREMLRIQRSVEVTFSHVNYVADLVATQVISKFNLPVAPEEKVVDRNALKRKFVTGDSAILTSADGESKNKHARNEEEIDI